MQPREDYKARQAREEQEKAAGRKWFAELKAAFLADGWRDVAAKDDTDESSFAIPSMRLERASDGFPLYTGLEYQHKTWSASATCPRDGVRFVSFRDLGAIGWNDSAPSASGSVGRDVQAVKKDILRRVVTPSEPIIAKARAKIADLAQRRVEFRAFVLDVYAFIGKPMEGRTRDNENIEGLNRVHVYGDGYSLELSPGGSIEVKTSVGLETFKDIEPFIRIKQAKEEAA